MNNVAYVTASGAHAFVIRGDGNLWGWGHNGIAQLGDGTVTDRHTPIFIMDYVSYITTGWPSFAIRTDNSLWTWGYDVTKYDGAQLSGDDDWSDFSALMYEHITRFSPEIIMRDITAVSFASWTDGMPPPWGYVFTIRPDGNLWGWGWNTFQILRETDYQWSDWVADPVLIMEDVTMAFARPVNAMAVRNDGSLWVWGQNWNGTLGDGTNECQTVPVRILENVAYITGGMHWAMAVTNCGRLYGWGRAIDAYLDRVVSGLSPFFIMDNVVSVSSSESHVMAIRTDRSLYGWGDPQLVGEAMPAPFEVSPLEIISNVRLPSM